MAAHISQIPAARVKLAAPVHEKALPDNARVPHTCAGFQGAFFSEFGRAPSMQEVWNAAIRSHQDLANPQIRKIKIESKD